MWWGTNSTSLISGKPGIKLRIPSLSPTTVECNETSKTKPPGRLKVVAYPPGRECCSRTSGLNPWRAKAAAQLNPPSPAPMITASNCSFSEIDLLALGRELQSRARMGIPASKDFKKSLLSMFLLDIIPPLNWLNFIFICI